MADNAPRTDVILPMKDPYMQQIVAGTKTYESRKYNLPACVERIWFYRTAPHSRIEYICEIMPARTRNPGESLFDTDGLRNVQFNARREDWEGYDFAYKILSVSQLEEPIPLAKLKTYHGFKSAPVGFLYTPSSIHDQVVWFRQKKLR